MAQQNKLIENIAKVLYEYFCLVRFVSFVQRDDVMRIKTFTIMCCLNNIEDKYNTLPVADSKEWKIHWYGNQWKHKQLTVP